MAMHIVILHGWGHSAKMWQIFASKLHGHKVTILDLPGFGGEKLISQNWGIDNYAKWVVKKIKKQKTKNKKLVLIGHSFGGKIATEIALRNPKMISKLILVASPVIRRPLFYIKLKIALYKLLKGVFPLNIKKLFYADEYKDAAKSNMATIFKKSVEYDRTKELKKLNTQTLIIWGEKDKTAPVRLAKEMHSLIPHSQLKIIKEADHNIYLENPNILYGLIQKFISNK